MSPELPGEGTVKELLGHFARSPVMGSSRGSNLGRLMIRVGFRRGSQDRGLIEDVVLDL